MTETKLKKNWWLLKLLRAVCANVNPTLIADQHNFIANYFQNGEKNWIKKYIFLIFSPSISYHILFTLIWLL